MITKTLLAIVAAAAIAVPAMAQSTDKEKNGHHYSGGPKTESHHMGKKTTGTTGKAGPSGSHHYSGGPREPHHIGPK